MTLLNNMYHSEWGVEVVLKAGNKHFVCQEKNERSATMRFSKNHLPFPTSAEPARSTDKAKVFEFNIK